MPEIGDAAWAVAEKLRDYSFSLLSDDDKYPLGWTISAKWEPQTEQGRKHWEVWRHSMRLAQFAYNLDHGTPDNLGILGTMPELQ